jgi:hypothetical protein
MNFFTKLLIFLGITKKSSPISVINHLEVNTNVTSEPCNFSNKEKSTNTSIPLEDLVNDYIQPTEYPIVLNPRSKVKPKFVEGIERRDKGVLEDYFFDHAYSILGDSIKNNVGISCADLNLTPDFVYIDETKGIYIVIEIDEPYSLNSLNEPVPIHHIGEDDYRNKIILESGWQIVRFAEEQIAKSSEECAKYVLNFISNTETDRVARIKCWSKIDSLEMIRKQFRNTYLPFEFHNTQKSNSNKSYRYFSVAYIRGITTRDKTEGKVVIVLEHNKTWLKEGGYRYDPLNCYIVEKEFWEKTKELGIYSDLLKQKQPHNNCRYQIYLPKMKFEGFGELSSQYFNLSDDKNFSISIERESQSGREYTREEKIEIIKRKGFKL